jgi:hypothetical protein
MYLGTETGRASNRGGSPQSLFLRTAPAAAYGMDLDMQRDIRIWRGWEGTRQVFMGGTRFYFVLLCLSIAFVLFLAALYLNSLHS